MRSHPEYTDLPNQKEGKADLNYFDLSGEFTRLLVGKGYLDPKFLDRQHAFARPITYNIEVKTTTGAVDAECHFSSGQYQQVCRVSALKAEQTLS